MKRLTEQPSKYDDLEKKSVDELIAGINAEDQLVAIAIQKVLPDLSKLISAIELQLKSGGRMFYLGCGSGGRLSVLDVIELPNTYGIDEGLVNVILAGGAERLVEALEEKKGEDVKIFDIEGVSVIADYFVLASASNANQTQALVDNVEEKLFKAGYECHQKEGSMSSTWVLMDYGDVIVHVFSKEDRLFYDLERIWRDGKIVESVDEL